LLLELYFRRGFLDAQDLFKYEEEERMDEPLALECLALLLLGNGSPPLPSAYKFKPRRTLYKSLASATRKRHNVEKSRTARMGSCV